VEWRKAAVEDGILAADQAANYSNWTDGSNQGSGFGAWALDADGSNAGFFIGAGWGLWANSGDTATASRPFSEALAVGQTFSVRLDHGSIENGGEVRIALQNSAGNDLWTFVFVGGEGHYRLNGSATAIPYTDASIAIALTLTSATTFSASITPSVSGSGATTLTGNLISRSDSSIRRFQARNAHAGDGPEADMFVDNLQIAAAASTAEPVFYSNEPAITVTLDGPTLFEAVYEEGELKETALIHYWNFNDAAALLTPTYTLKAGANIQVDLGATTEVLAGTGQDFAGENARFNDEAGSHLRINNPIGAALNVASPTVGFDDILSSASKPAAPAKARAKNMCPTRWTAPITPPSPPSIRWMEPPSSIHWTSAQSPKPTTIPTSAFGLNSPKARAAPPETTASTTGPSKASPSMASTCRRRSSPPSPTSPSWRATKPPNTTSQTYSPTPTWTP
jgi:hypothetical protein